MQTGLQNQRCAGRRGSDGGRERIGDGGHEDRARVVICANGVAPRSAHGRGRKEVCARRAGARARARRRTGPRDRPTGRPGGLAGSARQRESGGRGAPRGAPGCGESSDRIWSKTSPGKCTAVGAGASSSSGLDVSLSWCSVAMGTSSTCLGIMSGTFHSDGSGDTGPKCSPSSAPRRIVMSERYTAGGSHSGGVKRRPESACVLDASIVEGARASGCAAQPSSALRGRDYSSLHSWVPEEEGLPGGNKTCRTSTT